MEFVPRGHPVYQHFCLKMSKNYATLYAKNDQKCGAAVILSFTTIMPLPTRL